MVERTLPDPRSARGSGEHTYPTRTRRDQRLAREPAVSQRAGKPRCLRAPDSNGSRFALSIISLRMGGDAIPSRMRSRRGLGSIEAERAPYSERARVPLVYV